MNKKHLISWSAIFIIVLSAGVMSALHKLDIELTKTEESLCTNESMKAYGGNCNDLLINNAKAPLMDNYVKNNTITLLELCHKTASKPELHEEALKYLKELNG